MKARKYRVTYSEVDIRDKHPNDKWGQCFIKDTPNFAELEDAVEDTDGEALLWEEHELSITITDCGRDLDILSALPRLTVWCTGQLHTCSLLNGVSRNATFIFRA